jgi:hypothetical protein
LHLGLEGSDRRSESGFGILFLLGFFDEVHLQWLFSKRL